MENEQNRNENESSTPKKNVIISRLKSIVKSGLFTFTVGFIVLLFVGLFGYNIAQRKMNPSNTSTPSIFEKKASIDNFYFEENFDFPSRISITILPKCNIEDLELKFQYLDSNGSVIKTQYKPVGNVKDDKLHTVTIELSEIGFDDYMQISSCVWSVSEGTTSLFA
ncbi:MAG: hypothetical protein IJV85_04755 [Clostridia bacterium]|nr:hypothetical protein [Clostridia bacterium]